VPGHYTDNERWLQQETVDLQAKTGSAAAEGTACCCAGG